MVLLRTYFIVILLFIACFSVLLRYFIRKEGFDTSSWSLQQPPQMFGFVPQRVLPQIQPRLIQPIKKIFIVNKTEASSSTPAISRNELNRIIEALNIQLETFCRDWSTALYQVVESTNTNLSPSWNNMTLYLTTDTKYELENGLGYHSISTEGVYSIIFVGRIISRVGNASIFTVISTVTSHEILEMIINPMINTFFTKDVDNNIPVMMEKGVDAVIAEVADPIKPETYNIITTDGTEVRVSDYLLPSWYSINGKPPYNHNNTLPAPFTEKQRDFNEDL